jgi:pimeloyl-ACP methyl ester carboxylesterase
MTSLISTMRNITSENNDWVFILSLGLIVLLLTGTSYNTSIATSSTEETKRIPLYYISTRDPQNPAYTIVTGPGYKNFDTYRNFSELTEKPCKNETVVIFVHGWEESEDNVKERLDRVKLSLENNSFIHPLVGFSWPSDTLWASANSIAAENGPKLAKLISDVKNECPGTDIRLLAHSLGARVVLNSLESLHKNQTWNGNNFTIKSVDLLGAAVDDEEVSTNPQDILIDLTNLGTPKSDYGQAIEAVVMNFTNSFSTKDNTLEPNPEKPFFPFQVYPSFDTDLALGQSGYQKVPYDINTAKSLPDNYIENDVKEELVANCDADGDKKIDLPFQNNQTVNTGDNHRGYLGYRNITDNSRITDDGAIDIIVENWNNRTSNTNPNLESSSICHDSP